MQWSVLGFHVFKFFKLVRFIVAVMLRLQRLLQLHYGCPSLALEPRYGIRMLECGSVAVAAHGIV